MKYSKKEEKIVSSLGYVEDTIRGRLVGWMNEIIKEKNLSFDYVDVQIKISYSDGKTRRFPDITIWEKKGVTPACLIELKRPEGWTPYDSVLINDAQSKVMNASPQVPYFGTWNINELVLWKTFDPEAKSLIDRRKARFEVVSIKKLEEIDKPEVEQKIKKFLEKFLRELEDIYYERKDIPKIPIDEFFIFNLRSVVDSFSFPISEKIKEEFTKNSKFRNELTQWFVEQGWIPPSTDEDFEKTSRQFLYLFIDKILFYNTLKIRYKKLKGIKIPKSVKTGLELKKELQKYFDRAEIVTKDYVTIFVANFIEAIPVPDEIVFTLKYFINGFSKYDFSKLGFRDIGRIFDRLIPEDKRHKLGQYFTRSDVVDLINGFCIRKEGVIADFGCGAGTFLVRGYARLKNLYPEKEHRDLLAQLWGVDISKFAAHLSTISLTIRDLSEIENYPRVFCEDFFDVKPKIKLDLLPKKYAATRLDRMHVKEKFPLVDAVVGNPPYTRQEELEDYIPNYKRKIEEVIKKEWEIKIGKRAGIHVYFFIHGASFLKEKGRFGYITSNSWLDVDYGKYLQEFFLKHFKIIAIIESKIERWFADADVNTAITVLERCYPESIEGELKEEERKRKREERNKNLVKFVQLKVPLSELIPNSNEEERWRAIDDLINFIENKNELYEDERIRVYPKLQKELWKEGYDEEKKQYIGSKWGKYIRAPDIFFKVLEKGKDLFVPLKEVAKVRRGFTTGANEFFYLTEDEIKKWGIEKEFWMHKENGRGVPNYAIKSPRECTSIVVDPKDLKYRVLMIHKDKKELKGTNVLKYIGWGEEKGFHKRPTCASRKRWYEIEVVDYPIVWRSTYNKSFFVFYNLLRLYIDKVLYGIAPHAKNNTIILLVYLNSTLVNMLISIIGTFQLGQGALFTEVYELKKLITIDPSKLNKSQIKKLEKSFNELSKREIGSVFEEIGASSPEEVSLDKVKPDRRELDKIIMEDILGLTEEEELEVYRAVVDLVKSRIEKAKSVKKKKKGKGPDPEILTEGILKELDLKLKKFPDDYLEGDYEILEIPEGNPELGSDLHGFFVKIGDERINCEFQEKARYIYYAVMNDYKEIKIPKDEEVLRNVTEKYKESLKEAEERILGYLNKFIPDKKLREGIESLIWKKLGIKYRS